jgi:hypothetical protein
MRRPLLSIVTASVLLAGAGLASAQSTSTTTTTWSTDQGNSMREYSTTRHYQSFEDPNLRPEVGMELPGAVVLHPLPETMSVPSADRYSYGMVNDHPVVVETTTRRVVHNWN